MEGEETKVLDKDAKKASARLDAVGRGIYFFWEGNLDTRRKDTVSPSSW